MNEPYLILINPTQNRNLSFEPWLFNTEAHLNLWKSEKIEFYWFNNQTKKSDALLILQKTTDNSWINPLRGTFSGIDCHEEFDITDFIVQLKSVFEKMKLTQVILKPCAKYSHSKHSDIILSSFSNSKIDYCELNYHIDLSISNKTTFHKSKNWRLNNLKKSGYTFEQSDHHDLSGIHDFLKKARERKSFPTTISEDDFIKMIQTIPDKYYLFKVKKNNADAAISICVNLGKNILYNLYSADTDTFLKDSPMTLLYAGMFEFGVTNHFKILDLGISTYKGIRNEGLIHFKKSLGALETEKPIINLL